MNNKGGAETINILTLFGDVKRGVRSNQHLADTPMHVREPSMSPIDRMSLWG